MSWDTNWQLEGLTMFGPPLNIWEMELYISRYDQLPYQVVHMRLDKDPELFQRLMVMIGNINLKLSHLYILEQFGSMTAGRTYRQSARIERPELYSVEKQYRSNYYPYDIWEGVTLGISFDRSDANKKAAKMLFSNYKDVK